MAIWARLDGCPAKPKIEKLPDTAHDGTTVTRKTYGPGKQGAEVVLLVIEGGGHTWPGRSRHRQFLGKVNQADFGQRPDLGVLPEAPDEVTPETSAGRRP